MRAAPSDRTCDDIRTPSLVPLRKLVPEVGVSKLGDERLQEGRLPSALSAHEPRDVDDGWLLGSPSDCVRKGGQTGPLQELHVLSLGKPRMGIPGVVLWCELSLTCHSRSRISEQAGYAIPPPNVTRH